MSINSGALFLGMGAKVEAQEPPPPPPVLPIVFVPGIMGTNLRVRPSDEPEVRAEFRKLDREAEYMPKAWQPPNATYSLLEMGRQGWQDLSGTAEILVEAHRWDSLGPALRQVLLNPLTTEVASEGFIPEGLAPLRSCPGKSGPRAARERGWGKLHWDSYGAFLANLENNLNKGATPARMDHEVRTSMTMNSRDVGYWMRLDPAVLPSDAECAQASRFLFPVHAFSYNWTRSNLEAADQLASFIAEVLSHHAERGCGKVIVVTHSMGGLVARTALKKHPHLMATVLGIVHGAMPAIGAPVAYRRMVAGTEVRKLVVFKELRGSFALFAGRTAADTTAVMAQSPGALELLPSHLYPDGWLLIERGDHPPHDVKVRLPVGGNPYDQIYKQKGPWWALVNPRLLDPAGLSIRPGYGREQDPAWSQYVQRIDKVREFHKEFCQPDSYHADDRCFLFYGSGYSTYDRVRWRLPGNAPSHPEEIRSARSVGTIDGPQRTLEGVYGSAQPELTQLYIRYLEQTGGPLPGPLPPRYRIQAVMQDACDTGDGTVPVTSGAAPGSYRRLVARLRKFLHQDAFLGDGCTFTQMAIWKLAARMQPAP